MKKQRLMKTIERMKALVLKKERRLARLSKDTQELRSAIAGLVLFANGLSEAQAQSLGLLDPIDEEDQPAEERETLNADVISTQADMIAEILADAARPLKPIEIAQAMIGRGYPQEGGTIKSQAVRLRANLYRVLSRYPDRFAKRDGSYMLIRKWTEAEQQTVLPMEAVQESQKPSPPVDLPSSEPPHPPQPANGPITICSWGAW